MKRAHVLLIAAFVICSLSAPNAGVAADRDTVASGSWSDNTKWSPDTVPVSGDSVNIAHQMTVSDVREFGSSTSTSIWNNVTLKIPNGHLTHVAGSTLAFTSTQGGPWTTPVPYS